MNPHAPAQTSLFSLFSSLWRHRELIWLLTKRDVIGRYKGSMLGIIWSFANPIILLIVYTFVFSVVFKARWGGVGEGKTTFALLLFVGMIIYNLFSETLTRAPILITSNVSYVKKILFPLEILPVVALGASLFHALVSLSVLGCALVILNGFIPWTALLLPLLLMPLILLSLGVAWMLSSFGVFIRDVVQPIGLAMTILLFASPIFYPVSALPENFRIWVMMNPLTFIIEQAREVLIFGRFPDFIGLVIYFFAALMIAWIGYVWFQKTRKGFANVL